MAPTHYEVLGIARSATLDEVRKAFRRKALETHPDKVLASGVGEVGRQAAEARFRRVREAFEVLVDEERRRAYDALLSVPLPKIRLPDLAKLEQDHRRRHAERRAWAAGFKERHDARERERVNALKANAWRAEQQRGSVKKPGMNDYEKLYMRAFQEALESDRKAATEHQWKTARTTPSHSNKT